MKNDAEVKLLLEELRKGKTLEAAAARAGMSERTARKYKKGGIFPSQSRKPRTHRTRPDPFERDWTWVQAELERDAKLQATGAMLNRPSINNFPAPLRVPRTMIQP